MNEIENESEMEDMKIFQPDEYELSFKILAPDRRTHQGVFNHSKYRMGYIHNKLHREDDSFYSPYLVYEIGNRMGISVPETEVGIIMHPNVDKYTYTESFFESSIVYDREPYMHKMIRLHDNLAYVAPEIVEAEYFANHQEEAWKRRTPMGGWTNQKTVENYVESYTWYIINHGKKPAEEYTKQEIDEIKQELVDRALFSLRYDSHGNFDVRLTDYKNAELEPYYPSKMRMYMLNVREEKVAEHLTESEEEFRKTLDSNDMLQYVAKPGELNPTVQSVVRKIFEKYPEYAEKSYKKLSAFTTQDMEALLETCTRMSDNHKKFALRAFEVRGKDFDEVYQEHLKSQEQVR